NQVSRLRLRGDGGEDGAGAIRSGDAGGDAARGLDGNGEGGSEGRGVVLHHQGKGQLANPVLGERQADEAPPVGRHEVDRCGGHLLRGHDEISLVLAVLVVGEDDHPPLADLPDGPLDQGDAAHLFQSSCHQSTPKPAMRSMSTVRPGAFAGAWAAWSRATYFPMTSASTLTRSPIWRLASVVRASVSAMSWTSKRSVPTSLTVRLTPSSVTHPFSTN